MDIIQLINTVGVPLAGAILLGFALRSMFTKLENAQKEVGKQKDERIIKAESYQKKYQEAIDKQSEGLKQLSDSINMLTTALINIRHQGGSDD